MVRRGLIGVVVILTALVIFVGGVVAERYVLEAQAGSMGRPMAESAAVAPGSPTSIDAVSPAVTLSLTDAPASSPTGPVATPSAMPTPTQVPPTLTATPTPTQVPPTPSPTPIPPTASPTASPTGTPLPASTAGLAADVAGDPASVVHGYFDAVNNRDYNRAFGYITGASATPANVDTMARGYRYTDSIDLLYAKAADYRLTTSDGHAVTCVGFSIRANSTSGTSVQFGGWYGVVLSPHGWLIDMTLSRSEPDKPPTIPTADRCGGGLPVVGVAQTAGNANGATQAGHGKERVLCANCSSLLASLGVSYQSVPSPSRM